MNWNPIVVAVPLAFFLIRISTSGFTLLRTIGLCVVGIWFALAVLDRLLAHRITDWMYSDDDQPGDAVRVVNDSGESESIRSGVRDLLALLATPDRQQEYERSVPIANVPAELLCMWLDDLYRPDDPMFRGAFSAEELVALASFDTEYESVSDEIRPLPANVAALQAHSAWQRLLRAASIALESIAPTRS